MFANSLSRILKISSLKVIGRRSPAFSKKYTGSMLLSDFTGFLSLALIRSVGELFDKIERVSTYLGDCKQPQRRGVFEAFKIC
jgi:hypothetical protein